MYLWLWMKSRNYQITARESFFYVRKSPQAIRTKSRKTNHKTSARLSRERSLIICGYPHLLSCCMSRQDFRSSPRSNTISPHALIRRKRIQADRSADNQPRMTLGYFYRDIPITWWNRCRIQARMVFSCENSRQVLSSRIWEEYLWSSRGSVRSRTLRRAHPLHKKTIPLSPLS